MVVISTKITKVSSEDEFGGQDEIPIGKVFLAVKQAIARLHANSGHRSNRRLARVLHLKRFKQQRCIGVRSVRKRRPRRCKGRHPCLHLVIWEIKCTLICCRWRIAWRIST